jgi:hypothetical protein
MFFYYVVHGHRVPTTDFAEKAPFWTGLMTDGRVGLLAKVREYDFEAVLKNTDILVYCQFAALCKALAVLNAPVVIILECEKFVEARHSEQGQGVLEMSAIDAIDALRHRLQGDQPASGGKEELEPDDAKQKKKKSKVDKSTKETEEVEIDPGGDGGENPVIDITDETDFDFAGDDDEEDTSQLRASKRLRVSRRKPEPPEEKVLPPSTKKGKKRSASTSEAAKSKKAKKKGSKEKGITSSLKAAGDVDSTTAYLFLQEEQFICLQHKPIADSISDDEGEGCAALQSAGADSAPILVFMKIEPGFDEADDHVPTTQFLFEKLLDPSGYLVFHGPAEAVQEYCLEFFHEDPVPNEEEGDEDKSDDNDKSKKTIAATHGVGEYCRWTDEIGHPHEMVIIPAAKFNTINESKTADMLSAFGSAKATEPCKMMKKHLIGMPAYINFPLHGYKEGDEQTYSADAYSQVFNVFAAKWGSKGIKGGRIDFYAGKHMKQAEDAAALGGFYLGLAAFHVPDILRPICFYPASKIQPHHVISKLKEFLAEVKGANFDALEATYKPEELPRLQNVLRTTMLGICTNKYYTHGTDSSKGAAAAQEAMGRLHRLTSTSHVDATFEQFTETTKGPINGESGLKARVNIAKGAKFRIDGNVFSKFDPKNDVQVNGNPNQYYWDLSHDLVLRCEGLVKFINDPKNVQGVDPAGNVQVTCQKPRDCLWLVATKAILAGETIWLPYGVTFWDPDATGTTEAEDASEEEASEEEQGDS